MKTKPTLDEKRAALYKYLVSTKDAQYLASMILALMFKKDIENEYRELPRNYKK